MTCFENRKIERGRRKVEREKMIIEEIEEGENEFVVNPPMAAAPDEDSEDNDNDEVSLITSLIYEFRVSKLV